MTAFAVVLQGIASLLSSITSLPFTSLPNVAPSTLVLLHGVDQGHSSLETLRIRIEADFPELTVINLRLFENSDSLANLNLQVNTFVGVIENITEEYGPITFLGFSQGGLIGRAVIERMKNPKIKRFISLSSQLLGQYGIPDNPKDVRKVARILQMPKESSLTAAEVTKNAYLSCYNSEAQELLSICNIWNDPLQHDKFMEGNNFLPIYNSPRDNPLLFENPNAFQSLEKLVLIGGPDDGAIYPWQSSQFGFYDENLDIVKMEDQAVYENLGLRTLNENGKITRCIKGSTTHRDFVMRVDVYEECIKPWL